MKEYVFANQDSRCFDNVAKSVSLLNKPNNTATTRSNKMIVISQLIVLGVQWVYDRTVRYVKAKTSDLSLDDRYRIMREGSSVDDISISSSTSVSKPRKGSRGKVTLPTVPSTSVDDSRI